MRPQFLRGTACSRSRQQLQADRRYSKTLGFPLCSTYLASAGGCITPRAQRRTCARAFMADTFRERAGKRNATRSVGQATRAATGLIDTAALHRDIEPATARLTRCTGWLARLRARPSLWEAINGTIEAEPLDGVARAGPRGERFVGPRRRYCYPWNVASADRRSCQYRTHLSRRLSVCHRHDQ